MDTDPPPPFYYTAYIPYRIIPIIILILIWPPYIHPITLLAALAHCTTAAHNHLTQRLVNTAAALTQLKHPIALLAALARCATAAHNHTHATTRQHSFSLFSVYNSSLEEGEGHT